jgi:hypothetical protein
MKLTDIFCKVCTILFLLDILIKNNKNVYNNLVNRLILYLSKLNEESYIFVVFYKYVHFCSMMQIFYNCEMIPKINYIKLNTVNLLQKYKLINTIAIYNINFYQNNILLHDIPIYDITNINKILNEIYNNNKDNTLMVVSDYSNIITNPVINMICYYTKPLDFEYKLSSIKFLCMTLTYDDTIYNIELSTNKYNYYIVGTNIDKLFIIYYLKYVLNTGVNITNFDKILYSLQFCDHNANFVTINETKSILIDYKDYLIMPIIDDKIEDEFIVT